MGEYLFKCLERRDKIFEGKVLLTVLKEVASKSVRLRSDLDTNRIPESRIKRIIGNYFSGTKCDYILLLDSDGKTEILVPVSESPLTAKTVIFPQIAKLKGMQLLKKQERVELEANVVFSRSLINENVNIDNSYYVFEGRVGLIEPHHDAVAVRILTDKGTRVILNGEHIEKIKKENVMHLIPEPFSQSITSVKEEKSPEKKKVVKRSVEKRRAPKKSKSKRRKKTRRKRRSKKKR